MRKIVFSVVLFSVAAASAFPVPFQPTVLKLTVSPVIQYEFDGSTLNIPVMVTGTPADVSFLILTRDKGPNISKVMNGYLGWHYVNKIDTCVFMTPSNFMGLGSNTITWNGRDKDGALVPSGDYTYYMFGYDYKSPKIKMTQYLTPNPWGYRTVLEKDSRGQAQTRPVLYMSDSNRGTSTTAFIHTLKRWVVGNDPDDATLLETCNDLGYGDVGGLAFLPNDQTKFFHDTLKWAGLKITRKFTWVPNGAAFLDANWGSNGEYAYSGAWPSGWNFGPGVVSDLKDYLFLVNADISGVGRGSQLIVIEALDGSDVKKFDISKWWVNPTEGDPNVGGQYSGGPTEISYRNGLIALGCHTTCINSLMNPYADTTDDAVLWINRNGDYIGDRNWEPTSKKPWVCNDEKVGPYKYTTSMDDQGFVIFPCYDMGALSFGLYAPDGTGVAYKAYAAETASQKYGTDIIDYGSPYDGIYTSQTGAASAIPTGFWFIAQDSVSGLISSRTAVKVAFPPAFAVEQNTPNPFNPFTSISFTLVNAGKVTVDIYNAAGQKVDNVVNTVLSAGSHSVTWNASRFSAGAYFYTVKCGGFSKTMKMILLK
ncbi:MAG: FlgD immunoglobulin-like domain containing protein [Candidatus Latescibacter sp.]|nr:FlgD immunoglobulin-like domain containing protein [Candidatus Latescibacter sp.]